MTAKNFGNHHGPLVNIVVSAFVKGWISGGFIAEPMPGVG
jgi:hypothetical protein